MSRLLFEDIFEVLDKDPDGKHFDKGLASSSRPRSVVTGKILEHAFVAPVTPLRCAVSRFKCRSDLYEMDLLIDINVDIYPMEAWTWLTAAVNFWCFSAVFGHNSLTASASPGCGEVLARAVLHAKLGRDPNRAPIQRGALSLTVYCSPLVPHASASPACQYGCGSAQATSARLSCRRAGNAEHAELAHGQL